MKHKDEKNLKKAFLHFTHKLLPAICKTEDVFK